MITLKMKQQIIQLYLEGLSERTVEKYSKHLKNIFESGELKKEATVSKMETVQSEDGKDVTKEDEFYNPDVITEYPVKQQLRLKPCSNYGRMGVYKGRCYYL